MTVTNPLKFAARLALVTALVLLVVKFIAFFLTGSKAVLSDAIESIINVVTGAFVYFSISISSLPADENHPYGHGKIEAFSAGLEGGLIILAACMILFEAVPAFFAPPATMNLGPGIVLLAGAALVNLGVGVYLLHSGKKLNSEALAADGQHILTDFYTSAGVIIGLVLVRLTGWLWLDPLVACLVAVNIVIPGLKLVKNSIGNLMDEADPELLNRIVVALNSLKKPGWLYPHKLRALRSGRYHHIDLHISLPHYWPLDRVHAVEQEITDTLLAAMGEDGDVMIHVDPCEPTYCPACAVTPCSVRASVYDRATSWELGQVTGPRPANRHGDKKE